MINKTRPDNRAKGVLLPVFSLPSGYGTGCFSDEARRFIDWLKETGHSYWQILPLNPTGVADSPYQPLSSFAGNAYFIDPVQLVDQGLITEEELEGFDFGSDPARVDYDALFGSRMKMLRLAYSRFAAQRREGAGGAYDRFAAENAFWLEDFALFMALRENFGRDLSWDEWPEDLRRRKGPAMDRALAEHAEDVDFYRWIQFEFYRQWLDLKQYANEAGVKIIGDMPVYVSYDSSDCWADPDQFQLGEDLQPRVIAGVPPDAFAAEGQLWGNPLYDWDKMKEDGYHWWISRIRQSFVLYDVIRLDHFRGYEAYYSCAADAENAMHGTWHRGPGMDLFRRLSEKGGPCPAEDGPLRGRFIAEDLGHLTEGVRQLLEESGFPGTKVLQFAFDGDPANPYLTENYSGPCVVYTGTHDNNTTAGWFRELSQDDRAGILQYLGYTGEEAWWFVLESDAAVLRGEKLEDPYCGPEEAGGMAAPISGRIPAQLLNGRIPDPSIIATELLIDKAFRSSAQLAIIPLQDYLHLGSEARVNVPGTVVDNWCWRLK
ncbi:MAG: 4-alpha-glucanotransferase [Firmicutes bacterium]|nr:4-alpha-glucanotransferase [Bacillota bacterium]